MTIPYLGERIVLRPGVNAQLRAGYTETCMDLDILISGRITEVQYSNDGMTTNITLQSYGVELDQKIEANLSDKQRLISVKKYYYLKVVNLLTWIVS